jgi:hypothetical protein
VVCYVKWVIEGGDMKEYIGQSTLVPISFIVVIFFVAFWLSELKSGCDVNASEISTIKSQSAKIESKLDEISERLSRIEGRLDNINQNLREKKNVGSGAK